MRIAFAPVLVMTTFACNALVGYGDLEKTPGKGTSDPINEDSGVEDDSPCDLSADFGAPKPLAGPVNPGGPGVSGSATLTADELTLVYQRAQPGDGGQPVSKILQSTRKSRTDPFGAPTELTELGQHESDSFPALRADGRVLLWSRYIPDVLENDAGVNEHPQLMLATREQPSGPFTKIGRFRFTSSPFAYDDEPFPTADGQEVFFGSSRSNDGTFSRIFKITRRDDDNWSEPEEIEEIRSDKRHEFHAILTHDSLTMYFSTTREAKQPEDQGPLDIYTAKRPSRDAQFDRESVAPVKGVNTTTAPEVPTWISKDQCRLYITRVTVGATPEQNSGVIMMAERPEK